MNDLTKLTNEQLGDFIKISLVHGTNTQFSYELLHEVASRLQHSDALIKAGIANGMHEALTKQSTAYRFRLEDVVETTAKEPLDNPPAAKEEPVGRFEDTPAAKKAKKKEAIDELKQSVVAQVAAPIVEQVTAADDDTANDEPISAITADELKAKTLAMRQSNSISSSAVKDKLAQFGATTILTLAPKHYVEFNDFLDGHNV